MKLPQLNLSKDATMLALGIVAVIVVYVVGKKILTGGAQLVGGAVSGNNAITQGTEYQGTGVLGTLGAATNDASGGFFGWLGDKIGGGIADLTQPSAPTAATTVSSAPDDPLGLY